MRAALTHPASKAFQNKSQVKCFCMLCSCNEKDEIKKEFSVLILLGCCLWFHVFPWRHECEQIRDISYQAFYQRGKVWTFKWEKVV